jgi:hypothetical protein
MRLPIKLFDLPFASGHARSNPRALCATAPSPDEFERAVSSIHIDGVWKTTSHRRQPLTDSIVRAYAESRGAITVLEIGASCGIASLQLMGDRHGAITRYFVTDRFLRIQYRHCNGRTYFYHPLDGRCIMAVTRRWVAYEDCRGCLPGMAPMVRQILARGRHAEPRLPSASLIHPYVNALASTDARIILKEYDMLQPWPHEQVDVIKVANVLNRAYFSELQTQTVLSNLWCALKDAGRLCITDNRDVERVSVYERSSHVQGRLVHQLNGGSEASIVFPLELRSTDRDGRGAHG